MTAESQIWKIPINSKRADFDPVKIEKARQFCFSDGWVGIGWEVKSMADNCTQPEVYELILRQLELNEAEGKDRMPFRPRGAITAHRALAHTMQVDDLVSFGISQVLSEWSDLR